MVLGNEIFKLLDRKEALGVGVGCAHRRIPENA